MNEQWSSSFSPLNACLYCFEAVSSTMDVAKMLSEQQSGPSGESAAFGEPVSLFEEKRLGPCQSAIVISREQSQGRGRDGRSWQSERSSGIYVSYLFTSSVESLAGFSLALGTAVREVVRGLGAQSYLKWPNDVLAVCPRSKDYRKLAGILVDLSSGPKRQTVIAGIGLNVHATPELAEVGGISLAEVVGQNLSLADIFAELTAQVCLTWARFERHGFSSFQKPWEEHSMMIGKNVVLRASGKEISGVVKGVDNQGGLILYAGAQKGADGRADGSADRGTADRGSADRRGEELVVYSGTVESIDATRY